MSTFDNLVIERVFQKADMDDWFNLALVSKRFSEIGEKYIASIMDNKSYEMGAYAGPKSVNYYFTRSKDKIGTGMFGACSEGNIRNVLILLSLDPKKDYRNYQEYMGHACERDHIDIAKLMLEKYFEFGGIKDGSFQYLISSYLQCVADHDDIILAKLLIENGAAPFNGVLEHAKSAEMTVCLSEANARSYERLITTGHR